MKTLLGIVILIAAIAAGHYAWKQNQEKAGGQQGNLQQEAGEDRGAVVNPDTVAVGQVYKGLTVASVANASKDDPRIKQISIVFSGEATITGSIAAAGEGMNDGTYWIVIDESSKASLPYLSKLQFSSTQEPLHFSPTIPAAQAKELIAKYGERTPFELTITNYTLYDAGPPVQGVRAEVVSSKAI